MANGLNTKMARLRGRAPRGERLRAGVPHGHWRTTTFVAGLRLGGIDAPMVIGPINDELFLAYVRRVLVPTLRPGDLVIMDNLGSQKGAAVRHAIEAAGAELRFLPAYSPDLNPIENAFSPSPSSRRCSERPPRAPETPSGPQSERQSTHSPPPNAPISSPPRATSPSDENLL
jgi:hypothetical protein